MDTHQLAAILDDIGRTDLDRLTRDQLVDWLADSIRRHAAVEKVVLRSALIRKGQSQPTPEARLFGGAKASTDEWNPPKIGDLSLFEKPAALGDLRPVSHEVITGPKDDGLVPLAAGQHCLAVRVLSEWDLSYVLIVGGPSLVAADEIERWESALPPLLRVALRALRPLDPDTVHGRRQAFYEKLLGYDPRGKTPEVDLKHICTAWQEVSNADWVSLWLYNSEFDQLELAMFAAKDPASDPDRAVPPEERTRPVGNGVAAYCAKTHQTVHVADVRKWRRELDGVVYRAADPDVAERLAYKAFDCIPLLTASANGEAPRLPIVGVVRLHYTDLQDRTPHAEIPLLTMGLVTALAIRKSETTEQREILVELNDLAQRHLACVSRRPAEVRADYLKELIDVIKKRLHVGGVSIFYRVRFEDAVQCLATTGVLGGDKKPVREELLPSVVYAAGEGLTGQCYADAQLVMASSRAELPEHSAKFPEIHKLPPRDGLDPIVLVPIPAPPDGQTATKRALGVIRCVEHTSSVFPEGLYNFDATEIETLGFIADQVGPVLQVLEQRIERERTVSIVKHDLFAPLTMIRDITTDVLHAVQRKVEIREYDVLDTVACSEFAMNLVDQLDLDPTRSLKLLHTEPTLLEGDIIARLTNMLSRYARATKRMKIRFEALREIPALNIDRGGVERSIYNLLLNAIKYGEEGSTIQVEARRADPYFVVDISNHGLGIEPEEEPHLFKPYYRSARAENASSQGVGLGLTIAKTIMTAHGGDLRITSRKDPTVFSLLFPKHLIAGKEETRHGR